MIDLGRGFDFRAQFCRQLVDVDIAGKKGRTPDVKTASSAPAALRLDHGKIRHEIALARQPPETTKRLWIASSAVPISRLGLSACPHLKC